MNYYDHHIGDFNNATRHLTRIERSLYRDMLDMYYDTECPLPLDLAYLRRKLLARTEEESTAVEQVLNEFFIKTEQGWYNNRCAEVIDEYHRNQVGRSRGGKASAAKREQSKAERLANLNTTPADRQQDAADDQHNSTAVQQQFNSSSTDALLTINHKPLTINQTPRSDDPQPITPVELSVAMRKGGVKSQPADPRLIALAAQGVTPDTVAAACEQAKQSKPGEGISVGYVVAIIERWAKEATAMKVSGAEPPQSRASPGAQVPFVAKPILPVDEQVPSLKAARGKKPATLGDLKSLVKTRDQV